MDPFEEPFGAMEEKSTSILSNFSDSHAELAPSHSSLPSSSVPPSDSNAALEALKKKIASRTAAMDASSKEKEKEIEAEAKSYIQAKREEHDAAVAAARAENKKIQAAKTQQLHEHKKADAIWKNVDIMVDLSRPNKFSKNTERMRNTLLTMSQKNSASIPM